MDLLNEINEIFKKELKNDSIVITRESSAPDIEEWDSLTNITLIASIEDHYSIRLKLREILKLKNVGDLCDCIQKKLA